MAIAEDMQHLRHEIDGLHAARMAMMHQLKRFSADLRLNMARNRDEMRKATREACAQSRNARRAFISGNQQLVRDMIGAHHADLTAARRHFRRKRA